MKTEVNVELLPSIFHTKVVEKCENSIKIRASCKSESEVAKWIEEYEKRSKTNWISNYSLNAKK